jgi:hypothetical protein
MWRPGDEIRKRTCAPARTVRSKKPRALVRYTPTVRQASSRNCCSRNVEGRRGESRQRQS